MAAYSQAQNKAAQKYRAAHIKRIPLDVPNELYAEFRAACIQNGERVNSVLRRFIVEYVTRMDRESTMSTKESSATKE